MGETKKWRGAQDLAFISLSEIPSHRQLGRAHRFIDEQEKIFATTEELPSSTLPLSHWSQPQKAKKKIEISWFTKLSSNSKKSEGTKSRFCIESLQKSDSNVDVEAKQGSCRYKVTISNQFSRECSSLQIANWRTCHHIVWSLLNLYNISEGNQLLADLEVGRSVLENLILKVPSKIRDSLTRIHSDSNYSDKLINYLLFRRDHMWYLGRKMSGSLFRMPSPAVYPE